MDHRFQVFVSSTYSDLREERAKVAQAIIEAECFPAGMESFPASGDEQFDYIKRIIDQSDYYVLVIGGKYGSTGSDGISYTEKEFDYAAKKDIPILVFPHESPDRLPPEKRDHDPVLLQKLNKFRSKALQNRLAKMWLEGDGLAAQVMRSLLKIMREHPRTGWTRASAEQIQAIQNELRTSVERSKQLEGEVIRLTDILSSPSKDLSGGDDEVTLEYNCEWRDYQGHTRKNTEKATVTWNQLFCAIAPDLLDWRNEDTVSYDVARFLASRKGISHATKLEVDAMRTLRIQLLALGLIERQRLTTVAKTVGDFWRLTKSGQHQLFKLRPIRRSPTPSGRE